MVISLKKTFRMGLEITHSIHALFDDFGRYICHSATFFKKGDPVKLQGQIIRNYHAIEVGLTYHPPRPNASRKVVESLLKQLKSYLELRPADTFIFCAINALSAYCETNHRHGNPLPNLEKTLQALRNSTEASTSSEDNSPLSTTAYHIPEARRFDFAQLAHSRRSSRRFIAKPVCTEIIREAVATALRSPSACNRQPCKVYDITNQSLKQSVLEIQNNSSAWRESADHILVVTADLGLYAGINERHCCYVDGGLFAMTLIYALHAAGLGTCPLNLNLPVYSQKKLRTLLTVKPSEMFIMLIAVGHIEAQVQVPRGHRRNIDEVLFPRS